MHKSQDNADKLSKLKLSYLIKFTQATKQKRSKKKYP